MDKTTVSIQEAANKLKVSTKTLRRWEEKGILVPSRTTGSHRRYSGSQITDFIQKTKAEKKARREQKLINAANNPIIISQATSQSSTFQQPQSPSAGQNLYALRTSFPADIIAPPTKQESTNTKLHLSSNLYKIALFSGASSLVIFLILIGMTFVTKPQTSDTASIPNPSNESVLGEKKSAPRYGLRINIPAIFTQDVEFLKKIKVKGASLLTGGIDTQNADIDAGEGEITASNIVYSVKNGRGIYVSGDQDIIITNTDPGSSQKIFKTIKSGSTTVSAATNSDVFEFAAGDNVSLSLDTTNKKLTISADSDDDSTPTAQGWSFDDGVISLEDSTYSVGIGTSTPSVKLHVVGGIQGTGNISSEASVNASANIQTAGVTRITSSGALDNITSTEFNGVTYSWPGSDGSSGYALTTDGSGGLSWANLGGAVTSYWTLQNGSIFPSNTTVDFLVGGVTTAGAKFAVTNTAGGTPTALLIGGTGNLVLTSTGAITTTGSQNITIGDASTGNVAISPAGGSGTTTINGTVNLGSSSTGIEINSAGTILDLDGNVVISDTVDLGSTTTGIRVSTTGVITDIDGNISLSDNTDVTGTLGASGAVDLATTLFVGTGDAFQIDATGNISTSGTTGLTFTSTGNITLAGGIISDGTDEVDINDDLDVSGTLTSGTSNAFQVDATGNITTSGTTGITLSGSGADMAFSGGGINTISSAGTLQIGAVTLTGAVTGNSQIISGVASYNGLALTSQADGFTVAGGTTSRTITITGSDITLTGGGNTLTLTGNATLNQNLRTTDAPTFSGLTLTGFNGCALETNGSGVVTCGTDDLGAGSTNYWVLSNGTLTPLNQTLDLLVGGTTTLSSRFAFVNANAGTPTASISANNGDNSVFLTGLGNLGTTNGQTLTIGGATTGNVDLNSGSGTINLLDLTTIDNNSNTSALRLLGAAESTEIADLYLGVNGNLIVSTTGGSGTGQYIDLRSEDDQYGLILRESDGTGTSTFANFYVSDLGSGTTLLNIIPAGDNSNGGLQVARSGGVYFRAGIGQNPVTGPQAMFNITHSSADTVPALLIDGISDRTAIDINSSNTTANIIDVDTSTITSGNLLDLANTSNISTGNVLNISSTGLGSQLYISGASGGKAAVVIDQTGSQDILTASSSGTTKFRLANDGSILLTGGQTSDIDTLTGTTLNIGASTATTLSLGRSGQAITLPAYSNCVLVTSGTTVACGAASSYSNYWTISNGSIAPVNQTLDLLVGGATTASAKFAILNVNGIADPVATLSGTTSGQGLVLNTNLGTLQSLYNQTLTLGGNTTGNILLNEITNLGSLADGVQVSTNGTISDTGGNLSLNDNTDITGNLDVSGTLTTGTSNEFNVDATGNITTAGTLSVNGDTISADGATLTINAAGAVDIQDNLTADSLTLDTSSLTFSGVTTDITTGSNQDLTVTPNGTGNTVLTSDSNSGVSIGSSTNTPAPLSVSGGIGGNALTILNQGNSGDILTASSSGTTRFRLANDGSVLLRGGQTSDIDTLTGTTLNIGASTATTISIGRSGQVVAFPGYNNCVLITSGTNMTCGSTSAYTSVWNLNSSTGVLSPINGTLDLVIGGTTSTSAKFAFLNVNSGTPTFKVFNSTGAESLNLYHDGTNGYITSSTGTVNLGDGTGSIYFEDEIENDTANNNGVVMIQDKFLVQNSEGTGMALAVFNNTGTGALFTASASGGTRFVIQNDGNLGINNASPTYDIDVSGSDPIVNITPTTSTNYAMYRLSNGSNNSFFGIENSSGGTLVSGSTAYATLIGNGNSSAVPLHIVTNAAIRATFSSTGLLGLGTTSPLASLEVNGSTSKGNAALIVNQSANSLNDIFAASSSGTTRFRITNDGTASTSAGFTIDGTGNIQSTKGQTLTLGGNSTGDIVVSPRNNAGSILPGADNTVSLGSSPSARFKDLFLGPSSLHIICTTGDGCGQTVDYALRVNTSTNELTLAANGSSTPALRITESGNVKIAGDLVLETNADVDSLTAAPINIGTTNATTITLGRSGQILTFAGYTNGGSGCTALETNATGQLVCGADDTSVGGTNWWTASNGAIYPINSTSDLLIGGTTTGSAKFALLNINGTNTPVASISAKTGANAATGLTFNSDGTIQSLLNAGLTLGGDTTGNIALLPRNGSGNLGIGTTNPVAPIHLQGNGPSMYISNSGETISTQLFLAPGNDNYLTGTETGDSGFVLHATTGGFAIGTNGKGVSFKIGNNGTVGIGSTNPLASLEVNGSTSKGNAALIVNQSANSLNDIFAASSSGTTRFRITNDGTASTSAGFTIDGTGNIQSTKGQTLTLGGNSTGDIYLRPRDSQGFVKIIHPTSGTGGLVLQSSETDAADKYGRLKYAQYNNADGYYTGLLGFSNSTENRVYLGGGSGTEDAATDLFIFAASATNTTTGIQVAHIDETGFQLLDGSAGTPAYSFSNDTNTGFYRQGDDILSFSANGQNTFSLFGNAYGVGVGRQAIGDGTPNARLQIFDDNNYDGSGLILGGNAASYVQLYKSGTRMAAFTGFGRESINLGIGNATPSASLHVTGGNQGGNAALIVDQIGSTTNDILTASSSGTTRFRITNNGTASSSAGFTIDGAGNIQSTRGQTLTLGGTSTGDVVLDAGSGVTRFADTTISLATGTTINPIASGTLSIGTANASTLSLGTATTGTTDINGGNVNFNGNSNVASGFAFTVVSGEAAITGRNSGSTTTLRVNNHTSTASIFVAQDAATDVFTIADGGDVTATNTMTLSGSRTGGKASLIVNQASSGFNIFAASSSGTTRFIIDNTGNVGVGNTTPTGLVDISGNARNNAALIVNQTGSADILAASSSGTTRFAIENDGTVQLDTTKYADCDGLNVDSTGNLQCGAIMKRKAATEGITGSTALQDDNELTFSIGANETWVVQVNFLYTTNAVATNDIRVGLNNTGTSPTCDYAATDIAHAGNLAAGETTACNTAITLATTATGEKGGILTGTVTTGGGSGTVAFRWAQGTNDGANATTVEIGSSLMAWKINGADLAEVYYANTHLTPGTVLTLDPSIDAGVQRSNSPYANNMVGVVTTRPGKVLGDSTRQGTGIPTMVALSGRVPVYVSSENGPILPGDPLTSSSTPGVAMKATGAGNIIGIAMTGFDGTQLQGQVNMFIKSGYYDPAGQFVTYDSTSNRLSLGQGAESVDIASDLTIAGSISGAGLTDCRSVGSRLIYNGDTSTFGCVESLADQIENSNILFEGLGDITMQKEENTNEYLVFDQDGNTINTFLGAKGIKAGIVEAGRIIADEIIGKVADITSLKSTNLTSDTAVITGTLTAKEVSTGLLSLAEYEIAGDENLVFRGKTGQDLVKIDPAGNVEIKGNLVAKNIISETVNTGTISATTVNATEAIISKLKVKDLEFENIINNSSTSAILTVADEITSDLGNFKFLKVDTDLLVLGTTTLSDAAIENDLVVGGDLTIGGNSLNTTTTELAIQPLALQAIDLMAGAVRIETDGTMKVNENAVFAKDVQVQGVLSANTIRGIGDTLEVSGSARFENAEFGQVKVTPKDVEILSDTEVISNSTAGKLKLKAGETQLKVYNDKVTRDSLIFITPRRAITGPSLFTDTQVEGDYFIVEIPIAPLQDIEFNYLIVN